MYKITLLFILVFGACVKELSEYELLHKSNPVGKYGDIINSSEFIKIEELINNSKNYLDKRVLISGEIIEVCPMRGCWIKVKNKNLNTDIRVKVTDGEIVFPLSAKGKNVNVEGIFSKLEFSKEQAIKWKIHLAEEKGIELLHEDVVINPSDLIEYRIIGKAAEIYN
ncbi:MAG: hypothetical protein CMF96_00095 [Candidatus Marinimicrobia bacterium]|nr:hypothetical protein [Candidatus Neomarinimicrobiota bacterium]|tara:strand:+ start:1216 stop:1716 length:501 start_codon:yes stop_codon:yes gene_type:complete